MEFLDRLRRAPPKVESKTKPRESGEKEGPKIELDRNNQEARARLEKLLQVYQDKIEEVEGSKGRYQAPEVADPAYAEALYGRDFLKQLLAKGSVDTYAFTRERGRGLVQWAFADMMIKIEEALGIENEAEAA